MPKILYREASMRDDSKAIAGVARDICEEYAAQGFVLTLRQLYYQFVARGLLANKQANYKRLGDIVNKARLAGLIDWRHITDRTRSLRAISSWSTPGAIVQSAADSWHMDHWRGQTFRPEVWIEKDALVGVIAPACEALDVPYFSCRGYTSQSELWEAAQRMISHHRRGQAPVVIHLGDHDPSGIDMTRDIRERLELFIEHAGFPAPPVRRIALNMDQVEEYQPPPNPAKVTDSRFEGYMLRHGGESWELDALDPTVLDTLVRNEIEAWMDRAVWDAVEADQERQRRILIEAADRWQDVAAFLGGDVDG